MIPVVQPKKEFLTIREVALDYFGGKVSAPSIYRLVDTGEIPSIRVGRKYLVSRAALAAKYGV